MPMIVRAAPLRRSSTPAYVDVIGPIGRRTAADGGTEAWVASPLAGLWASKQSSSTTGAAVGRRQGGRQCSTTMPSGWQQPQLDRRIGRDRAGVLAMTRTRSGPSRTLPPHVTVASARNPSTEPVRHQMPAPLDRVHRLVRKTATVRHPVSLRSLVGANHRTDTIDKTTPVQQAPRHASSRNVGAGLRGWLHHFRTDG